MYKHSEFVLKVVLTTGTPFPLATTYNSYYGHMSSRLINGNGTSPVQVSSTT